MGFSSPANRNLRIFLLLYHKTGPRTTTSVKINKKTAPFLLWQRANTEYEYSYVGGDLRIDRIRNRSRRKHQIELEAEGIRSVLPKEAAHTDGQGLQTRDFTSGRKDARVYELRYEGGGRSLRVWIEPDEKLLELMKLAMPRKITL